MCLDSKHKPTFCEHLGCTDTFMMSLFGYCSLLHLVLSTRIKHNELFIVMVSTTTLLLLLLFLEDYAWISVQYQTSPFL